MALFWAPVKLVIWPWCFAKYDEEKNHLDFSMCSQQEFNNSLQLTVYSLKNTVHAKGAKIYAKNRKEKEGESKESNSHNFRYLAIIHEKDFSYCFYFIYRAGCEGADVRCAMGTGFLSICA